MIILGDLRIASEKLLYVESIEHYLRLVTTEGAIEIRARLSDIVAQTGVEIGIQPHRSWWVSSHAVEALTKKSPNDVLRLVDGTEIRVARGRRDAVRAWYLKRFT